MAEVKHICAFYSYGAHYVRLLKRLRTEHPNAQLTALVPKGYPVETVAQWADETKETEQAEYGLGNAGALVRLLKSVRAERYDLFAVMFESPKLRLLAALAGARGRYCLTPDGRFVPLKLTGPALVLRFLYNNLRGRLRYAYIHYVVHHKPVKRKK